tara:strand:+ start:578 stop:739 length:162 start_codon:yes stop_codon:yes gene_type:complete
VHSGTSIAIQRLNFEVVTERMNCLIEKKCVTVIWKAIPEITESLELLIRDEEL